MKVVPKSAAPALNEYLACLPDLGARPQYGMCLSDFTLERMPILMEVLGHPERQYPSLHIAGTNGKGSVAAFCAAVLQTQGYRVGGFTSPHLAGALTGITINQSQIKDNDLEETFQVMLPHLEAEKDRTQFEVVTALAFLHFARAKVDVAVIEVGLGGRLDATNVLTPLVSVITPIDYDHTSILGNTLAEIAREKAGIIKDRVPVVVAPQPEEARRIIMQVAEARGVQVIEVGRDVMFGKVKSDLRGQVLDVWEKLTPSPTPPLIKGKGARKPDFKKKIQLKIGMLGMHQIQNAVTAFAALQAANERGLQLSEDAIQRGFAAARWPGRFEVIQEDPPVVLDAAHSPAAAQALRAALDEYFPERPIVMVIGISADKDLSGIIGPLRERVVQAIATQSTHPRAMPANELRAKLVRLGIHSEAETAAVLSFKKALGKAGKADVILICGSVFLVELMHDVIIENTNVAG